MIKNFPLEWQRIEKIKKIVERADNHSLVTLGDDAFAFKNFPGHAVWCQDLMVEGVHFLKEFSSASDLGHKALAVNISDLVAMSATPHFVQVSLALPPQITADWIEEFYTAMAELADHCQCQIVGGDLTASPHSIFIDVSVFGSSPQPITRKGAIPGDLLLSSGPLGSAAVGLLCLQKNLEGFDYSKNRQKRPRPRWDLLSQLRENDIYVRSLMDCSDGLVKDAYKMIPFKGGLHLFVDNLPLHPETLKVAELSQKQATDFCLWGGEDYELLMAISPEHYDKFPGWHLVGQFKDREGIFLESANSSIEITEFKGFEHF